MLGGGAGDEVPQPVPAFVAVVVVVEPPLTTHLYVPGSQTFGAQHGGFEVLGFVHDFPSAVREAATSQAMNEPPISTTSPASSAAALIASELPSVRR